jgi:hypothetical protein
VVKIFLEKVTDGEPCRNELTLELLAESLNQRTFHVHDASHGEMLSGTRLTWLAKVAVLRLALL